MKFKRDFINKDNLAALCLVAHTIHNTRIKYINRISVGFARVQRKITEIWIEELLVLVVGI